MGIGEVFCPIQDEATDVQPSAHLCILHNPLSPSGTTLLLIAVEKVNTFKHCVAWPSRLYFLSLRCNPAVQCQPSIHQSFEIPYFFFAATCRAFPILCEHGNVSRRRMLYRCSECQALPLLQTSLWEIRVSSNDLACKEFSAPPFSCPHTYPT